jgi:TRAP-type C4-dicarboxylate transport system permease small subunit
MTDNNSQSKINGNSLQLGDADKGPLLTSLRFIIVATNLLLAVMVSITAIMRYVLKIDLYGIDEFILLIAFILYFAGSAYGAKKERHISADILTQYVHRPKAKQIIIMLSSILTLLLSGVFAWLGGQMFIWQIMKGGKTQIWRIPLYVPQGAIFLGLLIMTWYFGRWFVRECRKSSELFKGKA